MNLILASASPRRKDLLEHFGLKFTVQVLPTEEETTGEPLTVARNNALAKALPVSEQNPSCLVLGADTIVVLDGQILGKPKNQDSASEMLHNLSGRTHEVTTVVALLQGGQAVDLFSVTTEVSFRKLKEFEISSYIATGEPFDKAGGYGIQGFGGLLVENIKGCYYNVVGLPMPRLVEALRPLGVEVFPQGDGKGA